MVGHLFPKMWHDIRAFFCHVYLRSFLLWGVFIPKYMTIFLQTSIYMRKKSSYICVTNKHAYMWSQKVGGLDTELYRQQKPLHVQWSWKVTLVCIKHGRNGRVNFEQGLVLIHCPNSSGGCWFPDDGFVGICGLSLETQAAQAHYMNADVTLACERCCVTNGYLQRFVWDANGFS